MNAEAILALLSDLYTQGLVLKQRIEEVERERDMWKTMAEAVAPDEFRTPAS